VGGSPSGLRPKLDGLGVVVDTNAMNSSDTVVSLSRPRGPRRPGRLRRWILVSVLLVGAGSLGATIAARSISRADTAKSHEAFTATATQIASTLRLSIQHEEDLVISAAAFASGNSTASEADFREWTRQERAFTRYPELSGLGDLAFVPRSQLAAFEVRAETDRTGPLAPHRAFTIIPAGVRPYYCFVTVSQNRGLSKRSPAGIDYCATSPQLIKSEDSGRGYDFAIKLSQLSRSPLLAIDTPLYRHGGIPTTIARRRATFMGWIGTVIAPEVLLHAALHGHPGVVVSLRDTTRSGILAFTAGRAHADAGSYAESTTINLQNGSTVQISAAAVDGGLFADGNALEVLIAGTLLSGLLGLVVFVLATGRFRALRLASEKTEQLTFQAMHDTLTGLPNRALVIDRAELMLARARRRSMPAATMFIDVDGFKHVNDTFGHAAGDQFLRVIAARLSSVIRATDTVGRLGGDEFVVLVEGETLSAGPELVAERLLAVLREPLELDGPSGRTQSSSASIGIALGERPTADELLRDADLALYRAKQSGKDRYVIFEESMRAALVDRSELEKDLDDAMAKQQFYLLYQPTFDLQSQAVTGVEALIRWAHPVRGVMAPDVFIPLAEENAMIIPIGRWVLSEACRQAAAWHATGHGIGMSVNVSARQFACEEFAQEVQDALTFSGLAPDTLTLEITEAVLARNAGAAESRLNELKALGVRIAIDDFGTGSSWLAYLRRLPVDAVKIDRSFVADISSDAEATAITRMLINVGKALGLETLGEGIEDPEQPERLKLGDRDSGHGFRFARPLDVEAVTHFLEHGDCRIQLAAGP
jgi:diguanylate cyclase (GGDEF)-like protein